MHYIIIKLVCAMMYWDLEFRRLEGDAMIWQWKEI